MSDPKSWMKLEELRKFDTAMREFSNAIHHIRKDAECGLIDEYEIMPRIGEERRISEEECKNVRNPDTYEEALRPVRQAWRDFTTDLNRIARRITAELQKP
jgi:predicted phage-related endonuclease